MSISPELDGKKYKRSYKACLNCRTRKVKCDGWETEPPCSRCKRERKECIFVESRRGGQANVLAGRKRRAEMDADNNRKIPSNASIDQLWPHEQQKLISDSKLDSDQRSHYISNQGSPLEATESDQFNSVKQFDNSIQLPPPTSLLHNKDGDILNPYTRSMLSMSGHTLELPPLKLFSESQLSNDKQLQDYHGQQSKKDFSHLDGGDTGALEFLAKAAGNIARADQRDRINALDKHNSIEAESSTRLNSHTNSDTNILYILGSTRRTSNMESNTTTPSYASSPEFPFQNVKGSNVPPMIKHERPGTRIAMPPIENLKSVRPRPSSKLSDIEYIGEESILNESSARKFINLFFSTMHPFFPHIPPNLADPDTLAGYPILLCAILTISSRYHSFEELDGKRASSEGFNKDETAPKHVEVHERLWVYCQRLISQTVWAEASTRSIGTVFAFLLFTEWNPRAIHWRWSDYANADDSSKSQSLDVSDEGVAGLGAMRRSARMGWMLIGSAVRLAQDMGFMDNSSRIFLACHVSETFAAMNVSKRSMLSNSLSEIDLDSDNEEDENDDHQQTPSIAKPPRRSRNKEADEIELVLKGDEENLRLKTDTKLKFSRIQKAKLELLQIMSICYETLYGTKPKLDGLGKRENLAILNILSPLLENWHHTYKDLLKPTVSSYYTLYSSARHSQMIIKSQSKYTKDIGKQLDIESLIFDYHYARLYIYSLALTDYSNINTPPSKSKKSNHLRLDELTKSSKYVELAFNASKEMLACTQRLHKIRMLKYMPVRWVTRIVRAVAFVVKCYLTITASQGSHGSVDATIMSLSIIPLDEIISLIQKVAITLREASPDELHLCTRYSTILMYLCSEMKSKIANRLNGNVDQESDYRRNEVLSDHENSGQENQRTTFEESESFTYQQTEFDQEDSGEFVGQDSQNKGNKLDYDFFSFATDNILDWFKGDNGGGVGLDFVEPWTEMIEQQINNNKIE